MTFEVSYVFTAFNIDLYGKLSRKLLPKRALGALYNIVGLDRLLNKALLASSFGGGYVIPITVPYN